MVLFDCNQVLIFLSKRNLEPKMSEFSQPQTLMPGSFAALGLGFSLLKNYGFSSAKITKFLTPKSILEHENGIC